MNTSPLKRILSIILTVAMVFSMSGMTAFAEEGTLPLGTSAILDCHTEHDDDCGYIEAVAAADCTHEHDELCGFVVGTAEIPCDMDCTDTDGDGVTRHAEGCAYTEATEGTPCTHEHDDDCGYTEAITGAECTHTCELCEEKDTPTLLGITPFAITTHPVASEAELTAAITSASTGDTIQLAVDFNFANNITFPADKALILDLNSKTLTGEYDKIITIETGAVLTITDSGSGGTLMSKNVIETTGFLVNSGTLNINSGTLSVSNDTSLTVIMNSGTFNFTGGNFLFNLGTGGIAYIIENNAGDVTIDGMTLETTDRVFPVRNFEGGTVDIKNSTIRVGGPSNVGQVSVLVNSNGEATMTNCTISVASFEGDLQAIRNGSNGTAIITNCTISASGSNVKAISNDGTAKIINCDITNSGSRAIPTITNNGTLEITGGKLSYTPSFSEGEADGAIVNNKDLTIHSGVFTSMGIVINNLNGNSVTINDGIFVSTSQRYAALGAGGTYTVVNGIIISAKDGKGNAAALLNKVHGSTTLTENVNIPTGKTFTVPAGASLTIEKDVTLSNGGTLDNLGTVTNNGTVRNRGTVKTTGSDGTGTWIGAAPVEADSNVTVGSDPDADYASIYDAWNEAGATATITLTSDISFSDSMNMGVGAGKNTTLDLNGHTLEYTSIDNGIVINNTNTLTFKNGVYIADGASITKKAFSYTRDSLTSITLENCLILGDGRYGAEADAWKVHDTATLYNSYTLAAGKTLTVPADTTLTIPAGVTLTNNGTIVNEGKIENEGTIISSGTLSGSGAISGSGEVQTVLAANMITLSSDSYVYTGSAFEPTVTVASTPWTGAAPFVKDTDYTVGYSANTGVGTATVTVTPKGSKLTGLAVNKTFEITKSASALTLTTDKTDNTVTYGDTITFAANVSIPTTKARAASVNTVDFYCDGTKLNGSPITLTESGGTGTATFAYDTTDKKIHAGAQTITAEYGGSGNLNGQTETISVTLNKKVLTAAVTAGATKVYDGSANFTDVALTLTGLETVDNAITATASGTPFANGKDVGASKAFTATGVTLTGTGSDYYSLATSAVTGTVAITQKALTITGGTVAPKQWDGSRIADVTALTFNGLVSGETLDIYNDYALSSITYDNANVGTGKTVTGTASLVSNAKTDNYSLTGAFSITGDITLADGPAAPTNGVVDDTKGADTFGFTVVSGHTDLSKYEYSTDGGSSWATVTTNPISVGNIAIPVGNLKVRIAETTTHNAGAILANTAAFTASIEGTVSISGTATYGETLTANPSGTQSGAVLHYQWKADTANIGTDSATLVIPGTAVGKTITVEVTATGYADKLTATTSTVAKKAVTATAGTISKVYDSTDAVEVADRTLTITKVNAGDDITVTAPNAAYNNADVGTGKQITFGTLTITGSAIGWYDVTAPTGVTGEITAKPLTWNTNGTVTAKSYDGTNTATVDTAPTLNGVISGDTVNVSPGTVTFANANAGTGKAVTATGWGISGTDASNYTAPVSQPVFANGTITPKAITPTIETIPNQTYTGAQLKPTVTVKDGSDTLTLNTDYTVSYGANVNVADGGSVTVTLEGNYSGTATANFTIDKATATGIPQEYFVVTNHAENYQYTLSSLLPSLSTGQSFGTITYEVDSVANTDGVLSAAPTNADIASGKLTLKVASIADENKTATVTIQVKSENYDDFTAVITVKTTNKIPLTIGNVTVSSRAYNGTPLAYTGTPSFTKTTDGMTVTGISFTKEYEGRDGTHYTKSTTAPTSVGKYNLILTVSGTSGITYVGDLTVGFEITKKAATVTATDKSMTVDTTEPTYTFITSGFVSGESITGVVFTVTGLDTTTAGSYPIVPSGGTVSGGGASNYDITYTNGTLYVTVDTSALTTVITAANNAKSGITVDDRSQGQVTRGTKFVSTAVMTALNQAIAAAEVVKNTATTALQVSNAITALNNAIAVFNAAIQTGTYTSGGGSSGDSGSGGSGGYTPSTPITTETLPNMPTTATSSITGTVKDGVLTATITEKMAKDAIAAAKTNVNGIAVQFDMKASGNFNSISATLDRAALEALKTAGVKHVKIGSAVLDLTLDTKTIAGILAQTTGNVTVSATKQTKISDSAKALIGTRPVFDITIKDSKGKSVSDLKGGTAIIGIAYKPTNSEKSGNLYGVYVDSKGKPQLLTNSSYENGKVIFNRGSFSIYGVGYKTPVPAFTDTTKHWAKDNIDFVASRGLIVGTTATTFAPDVAITRATFLMALGKLSGADVSGYKKSSFTDVKNTDPAMPYIEWAVKNKITAGVGDNKFAPDQKITREQMAVMMVRYAEVTGYKLPVSRTAVTFADNAKISTYAKEAVKAIQQTGVMSGKPNNVFDPQGNATRAEASTILRRFVELVIDEGTARGWVQNDGGQWQYISENGKATIGWLTVTTDGSKYYFDSNGIMQTGWQTISGSKYYFDKDGKMQTGKVPVDGKTYYFNADGTLAIKKEDGDIKTDKDGVIIP